MKLRRRKASQIAALAEMVAGSDNDDPIEAQASAIPVDSESDEEYGAQPSKPQRRAPARRRRPAGPVRPDLVELVLGQMGRKDLFCDKTLKALRLTSHSFKALIDGIFSCLSTVIIHNKEGFKQLMKSPSTIHTMDTFHYAGGRALDVSGAAALMVANPSQLKKLVLDKAGLAFDILVHSSLPNLTSLKIDGLDKKTKALEWLCHMERERVLSLSTSVWPLQELELCIDYHMARSVLVTVLQKFQQLRKLTLHGTYLPIGALGSEGFLEDSFPKLETLVLDVNDPNRLDLLNKARLPALLQLDLKWSASSDCRPSLTSLEAPWIQQLQSLTFTSDRRINMFAGSAPVLSAFHSGALKTVVIRNCTEEQKVFESANLQGLTNLELHVEYYAPSSRARIMAALTTASLPLLSKLTIIGSRHYNMDYGDISFLRTFPQLRSLSIGGLSMSENDWAWFIAPGSILSRLEEFGTSDDGKFISSIHALNPTVAAWPLMQKLALQSSDLVDILSLAPHFPSITALKVSTVKKQPHGQLGEQAAHQALIEAALSDPVWPDLKSLSFSGWGWYSRDGDVGSILQRAWPRASIHR